MAEPQSTDRSEIITSVLRRGNDDIELCTPTRHHGSILTSTMLSVPVPCSQKRTGSPTWARP